MLSKRKQLHQCYTGCNCRNQNKPGESYIIVFTRTVDEYTTYEMRYYFTKHELYFVTTNSNNPSQYEITPIRSACQTNTPNLSCYNQCPPPVPGPPCPQPCPPGPSGPPGFQGATGISGGGTPGHTGATGIQGFQGATGISGGGTPGATGIQGFQGATGLRGPAGSFCFQGKFNPYQSYLTNCIVSTDCDPCHDDDDTCNEYKPRKLWIYTGPNPSMPGDCPEEVAGWVLMIECCLPNKECEIPEREENKCCRKCKICINCFDMSKQYHKCDLVKYDNGIYQACSNVKGEDPRHSRKWELLLSDGRPGEDGKQGKPGNPGKDGNDGIGFTFYPSFDVKKSYVKNDIVRVEGTCHNPGILYIYNGCDPSKPGKSPKVIKGFEIYLKDGACDDCCDGCEGCTGDGNCHGSEASRSRRSSVSTNVSDPCCSSCGLSFTRCKCQTKEPSYPNTCDTESSISTSISRKSEIDDLLSCFPKERSCSFYAVKTNDCCFDLKQRKKDKWWVPVSMDSVVKNSDVFTLEKNCIVFNRINFYKVTVHFTYIGVNLCKLIAYLLDPMDDPEGHEFPAQSKIKASKIRQTGLVNRKNTINYSFVLNVTQPMSQLIIQNIHNQKELNKQTGDKMTIFGEEQTWILIETI